MISQKKLAFQTSIRDRVMIRRNQGASVKAIARYAYQIICQCGASPDDLGLLLRERVILDQLLANRAASKAAAQALHELEAHRQRAATAARDAQIAAAKARRAGMRKGNAMTAAKVREQLGCTLTELNRWAADGRLPPDGKLFLDSSLFGKGVNARAWLPATVEAAKASIGEWRTRDRVKKTFSRRGLRAVA